jgi:hypothetical protein
MASSRNIKAQKTKIFQVLESLKLESEEFNADNFNWKARINDPKFKDILNYFVSYNEMSVEYDKWHNSKDMPEDETEELILSSEVKLEDYIDETQIDLKKIANFLTGKEDTSATDTELRKLKMLLDNTSKAGNTFLSMMLYKQMERVGKLIDSLEVAESRLYSAESILNTKPEYLGFLIERLTKTIDSSLAFIDKVSNREIEERKKGNHITINQHIVAQGNTPGGSDATTISQPVRESFRILAEKLTKTIEV